jgi:hypothetical protein
MKREYWYVLGAIILVAIIWIVLRGRSSQVEFTPKAMSPAAPTGAARMPEPGPAAGTVGNPGPPAGTPGATSEGASRR